MYNSQTHLTDSLERELMAYAIAGDMRYRPFRAIKRIFSRLVK